VVVGQKLREAWAVHFQARLHTDDSQGGRVFLHEDAVAHVTKLGLDAETIDDHLVTAIELGGAHNKGHPWVQLGLVDVDLVVGESDLTRALVCVCVKQKEMVSIRRQNCGCCDQSINNAHFGWCEDLQHGEQRH